MERNINFVFLLILFIAFSNKTYSQVSKVEVSINNQGNFELQKNGVPYYIKGAGAKDHFDLLVNSGANSIRIWSTNNSALLDSAYQHGLTVTLGLHVRPERSGMDYNNEYAVKGQIEQLKNEVLKYKLNNIKIASGEIVNYPLLKRISETKDVVYLSTGCSKLHEIKNAIKILRKKYKEKKIYLLHCVSSYPVPVSEINLNSIIYLKKKTNCEIGYSDHGMGVNHIFASLGIGVKVIEKHFTLDNKLKGPDHKMSLNPIELKELIESIRKVEIAFGQENKTLQRSEKKYIKFIRQSLHASKFIKKGELLTKNNVFLMRPYVGLEAIKYPKIINKIVAERNYFKEDPIKLIDFKNKKNIKFLSK